MEHLCLARTITHTFYILNHWWYLSTCVASSLMKKILCQLLAKKCWWRILTILWTTPPTHHTFSSTGLPSQFGTWTRRSVKTTWTGRKCGLQPAHDCPRATQPAVLPLLLLLLLFLLATPATPTSTPTTPTIMDWLLLTPPKLPSRTWTPPPPPPPLVVLPLRPPPLFHSLIRRMDVCAKEDLFCGFLCCSYLFLHLVCFDVFLCFFFSTLFNTSFFFYSEGTHKLGHNLPSS